MNSLNQGVFDCTKIARLLFGLQSYSSVDNYMNSLSQGVFKMYKNSATTFQDDNHILL